MSGIINQPDCLHVPELLGGQMAVLCWQAVDGAAQYDVEACFDTEFGDTTATGKSWLSVENSNRAWSHIDANMADWDGIESVPESHTVYKGAGTAVPSPDSGLKWKRIDALDETWAAHDHKLLTWLEIATRHEGEPSWNSFDAMHLTFGQAEHKFPSWNALESRGPHTAQHLSCFVPVPLGARYAVFRIRARDVAGNISAALKTARRAVVTSHATKIPPTGTPVTLQLEGRCVNSEKPVRYKLHYHASMADLVPGKTQWQFSPAQTDKLWGGVTKILHALRKTTRAANVQLHWNKVQ